MIACGVPSPVLGMQSALGRQPLPLLLFLLVQNYDSLRKDPVCLCSSHNGEEAMSSLGFPHCIVDSGEGAGDHETRCMCRN